jgi:hypothetical protein
MTMLLDSTRFSADSSDPSFASVVLLCGFDGADGATASVDESSFGRTLTFVGDAQLDTAQFKFGVSSLLCDGADDRVSAADSADFEFDAGPFTVECHVRFASLPAATGPLVCKQSSSTQSPIWGIYRTSTGNLTFRIGTTTSGGSPVDATVAASLSTATWYHIAADRDADGDMRLYLDGVMIASANSASAIPATSGSLFLGFASFGGFSRHFDGWLDEVRVTKGVARYASDSGFTPPTAAYPRS